MKDILLWSKDSYIEVELEGTKMTYSDEPRRHYVVTLRDEDAYEDLKNELHDIYEYEGDNYIDGYTAACEYLETVDCHDKFFVGKYGYVYCDLRDREEIGQYADEACDKVWLMRSKPVPERPDIEKDRVAAVKRILSTYDDIPEDGYSDWECGYWNGILGALRWVLGDEKDFLDT